MLNTLIIILLVLWLVGLVTSTTLGGLIHLLLVIALVVVLVRIIQNKNLAKVLTRVDFMCFLKPSIC